MIKAPTRIGQRWSKLTVPPTFLHNTAIANDARQIAADGFSKGSWLERVLHWLAYSGVRLLAGWVGYGREME